MRVNDQNTAGLAPATSRTLEIEKADRGHTAHSGNADPNGDRVEFSAALGRLSQALFTESVQRERRVQQVATAYQSGKYQPSSRVISRAMIGESMSAKAGSSERFIG